MSLDSIDFNDPDLQRFIAWKAMTTYEEFLSWCHNELLLSIDAIESHRDSLSKPDKNEDDCSDIIATRLEGRANLITGVNIEREALSSGHCDITIKKDNFKWLCEAKIYKGEQYILDGHNQLVERYLAGTNKFNTNAGMLIYFKTDGIKTKIDKCKAKITTIPATVTDFSDEFPLHYKSTFPHPHTELDTQIVYFNVSLNHQSQQTKTNAKPKPTNIES